MQPNRAFDARSVAIVILVVVVVVQTVLLVRQDSPAPTPAEQAVEKPEPAVETTPADAEEPSGVRIQSVRLASRESNYLVASFDSPIGSPGRGPLETAPAVIEPETPGNWFLLDPYVLYFTPEGPFEPGREYVVRIAPERLPDPEIELAGQTEFRVQSAPFMVEELTLSQRPGPADEPAGVILHGQASFSRQVDPKEFIEQLTVVDPTAEEPLSVRLLTSYPSERIEFQTGPVVKRTEPRTVTARIDQAMTPRHAQSPLQADVTASMEIVLDPVLRLESIDTTASTERTAVELRFSAPMDARLASGLVEVEPETAFRLAAAGERLVLTGDFVPGATYDVTLARGLTAADGASLPERVARSVQLPDLPPSVDFAGHGMFLTGEGYTSLAVTSVNTDAFDLTIDRVYRNNIFFLLQYQDWLVFNEQDWGSRVDETLGRRLLERRLPVRRSHNQQVETPLQLARHIPVSEPGLYRVRIGLPGHSGGVQRWVLITDLGLVAKREAGGLTVWANRFSDLSSVAGADVELLSQANQVIARGRTDSRGFWSVEPGTLDFDEARPTMLTIRQGDDYAFLLLERFRIDQTGLDVAGLTFGDAGYTAYLYGERDIYRPGETVEGVAIVRDQDLSPPADQPFVLTIDDPRGAEVARRVLRPGPGGVAEFAYELPDFALTGEYAFRLAVGTETVGTYRVHVEEFLPDRITVEVDPEREAFSLGQELPFRVAARYFFGPPAADSPVEARLTLEAAPFAPQGYEAFVFGDPEADFQPIEVFSRQQTLSEAGEASFAPELPTRLSPPAMLRASITARVSERGGRGVTARDAVPVHAYPAYVGLERPARQGFERGEEIVLDVVAVDPGGEEATIGPMRAELIRDRWHTVMRRTPSGEFVYETTREPEVVDARSIDSAQTDVRFTPPDFGSYRVRLSDPAGGASAVVSFYIGGWGYSPWALENPARVEIVPDKNEYEAGETASFQVRSPFPGKLLLTLESDRVLDRRVVELAGNTAQVELPMRAAYAPNVYATAVVVREAGALEPGMVGRAYGAVPVFVDRRANKLTPVIDVPDTIRPERPLSIVVRAEPGEVVTVAAVDEGILQLIAQKTPDPFAHFYAKRGLAVDSADAFAMLLPEIPPTWGRSPAGGGRADDAMAQFVRTESIRRVEPVAFFSGPLVAGEQGVVTYTPDVPNFRGALRIMAVSADGRRFGASDTQVVVTSPLTVLPTFPRFLTLDERIDIPLAVRNETGADAEFRISLAAEGPASVTTQPQTVAIAAGREEVVTFTLATQAAEGVVTLNASAEGAGETARDSAEIPLRSPLPARSRVQTGVVESGEMAVPPAETGFLPQTATRTVRIGASPLVRFAGNLATLLAYPYGCAEQTTSRAFPLIHYGELARALDPDAFAQTEPRLSVVEAVHRLRAMRTGDGGIGLWPGADETHPYTTAYAGHFLVEADRAGFGVDRTFLDAILNRLGSLARGGDTDRATAAYACYVLALAGQPPRGAMESLWKTMDEPVETAPAARAWLAAAYAASGDMLRFEDIFAAPPDTESGSPFGTTRRDLAIALLARLDAGIMDERTTAIAARLVDSLDPTSRWTTQEAALGFLALGRWQAELAAMPPFSGALRAGSETISFTSDAPLTAELPPDAELTVTMDEGFEPGTAFYSVVDRGIPTFEAYAPISQGLEARIEYLTRGGQPADLAAIRQGELLIVKTAVRSTAGPVDNVAVSQLLPTGLEIENPRLASTERPQWMSGEDIRPAYQDLRDDRALFFLDLDDDRWRTLYSQVRAVLPGTFHLPPVQAEAMYDPALVAAGEPGEMTVLAR
jgi:uncharacterized protein YfaS (alpha-2-macroglobulin family)